MPLECESYSLDCGILTVRLGSFQQIYCWLLDSLPVIWPRKNQVPPVTLTLTLRDCVIESLGGKSNLCWAFLWGEWLKRACQFLFGGGDHPFTYTEIECEQELHTKIETATFLNGKWKREALIMVRFIFSLYHKAY